MWLQPRQKEGMTSRSLLSKWFVEYTSPVVVTIATAEVESICLKNGLLFHELLRYQIIDWIFSFFLFFHFEYSAFGHLDNLSATVRSVNHQIPVIDAHIRFERSSEVVPKSSGAIEEVCLIISLPDYYSTYENLLYPMKWKECLMIPKNLNQILHLVGRERLNKL